MKHFAGKLGTMIKTSQYIVVHVISLDNGRFRFLAAVLPSNPSEICKVATHLCTCLIQYEYILKKNQTCSFRNVDFSFAAMCVRTVEIVKVIAYY